MEYDFLYMKDIRRGLQIDSYRPSSMFWYHILLKDARLVLDRGDLIFGKIFPDVSVSH